MEDSVIHSEGPQGQGRWSWQWRESVTLLGSARLPKALAILSPQVRGGHVGVSVKVVQSLILPSCDRTPFSVLVHLGVGKIFV